MYIISTAIVYNYVFSFCPQLLIVRDEDAALLSSVQDLTLASCGFVSLPSSGLSASTSLARVTVRDMKLFHYTAGLFPALESLTVENVDELVLDGFGTANRTLRHLTLRRTAVVRLVRGTVTTAAPLRRVLFDRVDVDDIESGALDMSFVGDGDGGQLAAADGFTVVNSTVIILLSCAAAYIIAVKILVVGTCHRHYFLLLRCDGITSTDGRIRRAR